MRLRVARIRPTSSRSGAAGNFSRVVENMARSTRKRKPVDYRKLLGNASEDSDDDFASGPPSKRSRGGGLEENALPGDIKNDAQREFAATLKVEKKPGRLSRDEKQFSRQLEQAIQASKKKMNDGVNDSGESATEKPSLETSTATEMNNDEEFVPDETISSSESEEGSYSAADGEDSDFTASPEPKKEKKRKSAKDNSKSASKVRRSSKKLVANSEPMIIASTKTSPRRGKKVNVAEVKAELQRVTARTNTKTASLASVKELDLPISRTTSSSPAALGVNRRATNWTPPARIGEERTKVDSTLKPTCAGNTPVIRVGLSRNARVKSLHANIKT